MIEEMKWLCLIVVVVMVSAVAQLQTSKQIAHECKTSGQFTHQGVTYICHVKKPVEAES